MKTMRNFYHFVLAWLSSVFYGAPSRKITVVGLTGTKGKSTVLEILDSVLTAAGKKTALLSSVRLKIGSRSEKSPYTNTMPGRGAIQKFLKDAVLAKCEIALIEVTSEGIKQSRHRFVDWDAAVFLNLHPEHVEAHGSFEKYRQAKLAFFKSLANSRKTRKFFVINADDPNASHFEDATKSVKGGEVVFCRRSEVSDLAERIKKEKNHDWLVADFNIENVAVAAKTAEVLGASSKEILRGLENFQGLRGRMDFVQKEPFTVVVDYAHTPDSLKAVYETLRKQIKKGGQLVCVLGSAGGGRDKWKRPELGKIAAEYCDKIVLTSEDPYNENPNWIIQDIKSGIRNSKFKIQNLYEITDRKEALKKAISLAGKGDMVVSTGMGSQNWFYGPHGKKIPWDEHKVVEGIIA